MSSFETRKKKKKTEEEDKELWRMMRSLFSFQFFVLIWGLLNLSCDSVLSNEVSALVAFKDAIYEDPSSVLSNWNALDEDPCDWSGIYCSPTRDRVITLNLTSTSLNGFLAPELGFLTSLQKLILHNNSLLGTIPKTIGMLKTLTVLDLAMNRLSGPIPHEIGNLTKVMKIYLQSNGLTGNVPLELGNLAKLVELRLDRNKLHGDLPGNYSSNFTYNMHRMYISEQSTGFCKSPKLEIGDFSYNFFVGRIPMCLKYLPRSSFQGNCFNDEYSNLQRSTQQCGRNAPTTTRSNLKAKTEHRHAKDGVTHQRSPEPTWLLVLEIVTGTIASFLLVLAIFTAVNRWKSQPPVIIPWKKTVSGKDRIEDLDAEMLKHVLKLSRQELEIACEDFSNIIGTSPQSFVYKGTMNDGPEIAVVSFCISEECWTNYLESYFQNEVADLARLDHKNTGKLLAYCRESNPFSRMLVFEYASNGNLYEHLHYGEGCHLSWSRRMKIVIGIARGLKYLHTELEPPFTLSEMTSNAVYLTEDFSPKLVDFERWKVVLAILEKNRKGGTFCDFSESIERQHLDIQGNTFSFGVLLLEIISGRPPYCKDTGFLVDWAREYLDLPEAIAYLVDPELRYFRYDDLQVICEVVKLCIQSDPSKRPSMKSISLMLENKIDTSAGADLKESPLAWAELAISS